MEPTPKDPKATPEVLVSPICASLATDTYKQDELVKKLFGEFQLWENWRRPYESIWNRIYKLYLGSSFDEIKTTTRAKIQVPIVFQVIESALPKLMNTIFGSEEFFDVIPEQNKDFALAKLIKILITFQLGQADFFVKFMDFAKQLLLYGTSYFYVYWKKERKWVWERKAVRKPMTIMGWLLGQDIEWTESKSYKVVENRPEIEVLDILDVFPDPDAQHDQDGQAVWMRSWISYDELKEAAAGKYPIYTNIPDKSNLGNRTQNFSISRSERMAARGTSEVRVADSNKCEILTRWGRYDLDDDGIKEETQIVLLDGKYLIHADANPFHHQKRPIIKSVLFNVVKEWFGIGLIEPAISLVHELNTLRRQRLDNIHQSINRMFSVNSYADIDLSTLVSSPGGIILRGENPQDIMMLDQPDVTQNAYNEATIVQNDIQNVTAPAATQGTQTNGALGRTAKGAQLLVGQALEKFGLATKMQEEMAIKKILRRFHQLNLQFIDDDEVFSLTGYYGGIFNQQVTPEMIRADVTFEMKGISELTNKESKINQAISFMGIFGKVLAPETISTIAKQVWELMGFNPDGINIAAVQPMPPEPQQGGDPSQAIQGQVQQQGASSPVAMPGVNHPGAH
jgi:hypothetical protein